jgi:TldD protein
VKDLVIAALDAAVASGASYADVRSVETQTEALAVRGPQVEGVDRSDTAGIGVRVLLNGAWGYAASASLDQADVQRMASVAVEVAKASAQARSKPVELVPEPSHVDSWSGPFQKDPFSVPVEDKIALLISATELMERVQGVRLARGTMDLLRQKVWFASSEGSVIDQSIMQVGAGIEATALSDGEMQQRSFPASFRGHFESGGFEVIERMDLAGNAQRTAEQAVALLTASPCPDTTTTLILDGHQVMLQVHESVGHPTELDRVLGMEAAYAGTSFVGIPDLGGFRYGSDLVNITSDATLDGGLGTYGYDDEGVAAQRVDLIKDGILVGFQTSRETAGSIGADRSNGTMRAEGWENFPLIRMTNVSLLPGEGSLEDLMADVDDGVYMETNKSWSIDDKRKNFQFGCEIGWEIKNGRRTRMLKDPRYTGITPVFWASCDAIAGEEEWRVHGTPNCGKGQPGQTMRVGHGTSPARFRNARLGTGQ